MVKSQILDIPLDIMSQEEVLIKITSWLEHPVKSRQIVTVNALILMRALGDARLKRIIQQADLALIDGYGVAQALRKRGYSVPSHLPGVELVKHLLNLCSVQRRRVAFYGSHSTVVELLKVRIGELWPGIDLSFIGDGYNQNEPEESVKMKLIKENPEVLLVGLGSPAQEFFLAEILPQLRGTVGIGVGGSFEVLSGWKREAPDLIRYHGLEWLFRMLQNPSKLTNLPDLIRFWYLFLRR